MVQLLKLKNQIYKFIGKFEVYVLAVVRFLVAFTAFSMINSYFGFMDAMRDYPIALILALLCSFLPSGVMLFMGAALILVQCYATSSYVLLALVALIFLILFCVYFRFSSRKAMYAMLTPIAGVFGIPYVMPLACGLLSKTYAIISVICGEVVFFMMKNLIANAELFTNQAAETSKASVLTMATQAILFDREMYLYLIAFAIAGIVVNCIRKLSSNYSHIIAIVVGTVAQLIVLCFGEVYFIQKTDNLAMIVMGCIISLVIALFISVMTRGLDYSRVEKVQFEDDEYYYYVTAVPKASVSVQDKQVKQIHSKHSKNKRSKGKKVNKVRQSQGKRSKEVSLEEQVMEEFRDNN